MEECQGKGNVHYIVSVMANLCFFYLEKKRLVLDNTCVSWHLLLFLFPRKEEREGERGSTLRNSLIPVAFMKQTPDF